MLPVHPNPDVRGTVEALLCDLPGMHLIEPVDYVEFVHLMNRAHLILTDSGGVQEEAPSLGKPVLVLREVTERPEGVAAGTARRRRDRPGADRGRGERAARLARRPTSAWPTRSIPYGDGRASERIVAALEERLG